MTRSKSEVTAWLVRFIAVRYRFPEDEVDPSLSFDNYGVDSAAAVMMTGELADWLGCEIEPTAAYDYPSITTLAEFLSNS